jgi:NADH dehydrogenase
VDTDVRRVITDSGVESYDYLVLATGATDAYFGNDEWSEHAPGLKEIVDATSIRRRILLAFEKAETETNVDARRDLLTFVIVGGGPTGVEMAGAIAELALKTLAADFRHVDPRTTRVILVEAGESLLPSFPEPLSDYAKRALEKLGVEVRLGSPVTQCDSQGVELGDERITSGTTIWAAGVAASPAAKWLQVKTDRAGRVVVGSRLEVDDISNVFVVGDTAHFEDAEKNVLPGVAAVAKQQGSFVGKLISARVQGKAEPGGFRYQDVGQLATIGRRAAVVDLGWIQFKGRLAWWFWGIVHIYFLINLRSRMLVAIQWFWSYLTFDRGARLITKES